MNALQKYTFPLLLTLIVVGVFIFNFLSADRNNAQLLELGKINNTYHRANSCIITTDPSLRTKEGKNACYDQAEAMTGIKVDRFGLDDN